MKKCFVTILGLSFSVGNIIAAGKYIDLKFENHLKEPVTFIVGNKRQGACVGVAETVEAKGKIFAGKNKNITSVDATETPILCFSVGSQLEKGKSQKYEINLAGKDKVAVKVAQDKLGDVTLVSLGGKNNVSGNDIIRL